MKEQLFFLSEAVVQALGWTLVHSLWQGAAAAVALWIALPRLRHARQRYWAAYAALLAVLLAAVATCIRVYEPPAGIPVQTIADPGMLTAMGALPVIADSGIQASLWQTVAGWLEKYYPSIVTVWLLGFAFYLLRLAGGLYYVRQLRRRHNRAADAHWQERLRAMAEKLRYTRPVQLLESAAVQTPVALGFFKPVILLPLGMINQISPSEVEAVLAHELAHIVRRDWLFNLLQALIDALFYFHPAVWWISATARAERENCCDDAAVLLTGNRLVYAKTLVRLQELAKNAKTPVLALGMEGSTGLLRRRPLLLERIKRILHQPQPSTTFMEKMIATAVVLALITLWTLQANTSPVLAAAIREIADKPVEWLSGTQQPEPESAFQAPADTVKPQHKQRIIHDDGEKRVEMELEDGKITRLNVDGKEIEESDFPEYESLTDELLQEAPPAPPAPPFPPGIWVIPPAPPAAPGAPAAPMAPLPGHPSRISTDKDDAGNTIIRIERNGKPTEIKVKDGEVWLDGKKLETGESLEIPGDFPFLFQDGDFGRVFRFDRGLFSFPGPDSQWLELPRLAESPTFYRLDGGHLWLDMPDGKTWKAPMPGLSGEELERIHEEAAREMERQQQELEKQMKEAQQEWKKSRKEWEKSEKEQRKAMEQARKELEKARTTQREALAQSREAQAKAREEARVARQMQLRAEQERRGAESTSKALKEALMADKLISDPNNFSFELSGKELRVDGKKLSDEQHKKYLELYRRRTGKELGKKDSIRIEEEN